jgi:hypothetical protein
MYCIGSFSIQLLGFFTFSYRLLFTQAAFKLIFKLISHTSMSKLPAFSLNEKSKRAVHYLSNINLMLSQLICLPNYLNIYHLPKQINNHDF